MSLEVALVGLEFNCREARPKKSFLNEKQAMVGPRRATRYAPGTPRARLSLQKPPLWNSVTGCESILSLVERTQDGKNRRLAVADPTDEAAINAPVQTDIGSGRDRYMARQRDEIVCARRIALVLHAHPKTPAFEMGGDVQR